MAGMDDVKEDVRELKEDAARLVGNLLDLVRGERCEEGKEDHVTTHGKEQPDVPDVPAAGGIRRRGSARRRSGGVGDEEYHTPLREEEPVQVLRLPPTEVPSLDVGMEALVYAGPSYSPGVPHCGGVMEPYNRDGALILRCPRCGSVRL